MQKIREKLNPMAVIYIRVSSKEQVEGTSLDMQDRECKRFCNSKGLEEDRTFREEGESAKVIDRTELKKLLDYCRKNKGNITHLVVYKYDRLARNILDHLWIEKELSKLGISVVSATEPIENSPAGRLQEGMIAMFNQYDNELRAERCQNGMEEKIKSGIWCLQVPIGYKKYKTLAGKEKKLYPDVPDLDTYPFIEQAWKLCLTGNYTISEITRKINKLAAGKIKIYPQKMSYILQNKYYCGILVSPFSENEYKGLHQPMITPEEFLKAQQIINSRRKKIISKKWINPDFPLRGFIRCGSCNNPYTGSWSTARNKAKHAYYFCYKGGCSKKDKGVKKLVLEKDFLDYLSKITPKREFLDKFEKAVVRVWNDKYEKVNADYIRYEKQLEVLKRHKSSLIDMKAKNLISDEEFKEERNKSVREIELVELAMNDSKIDMFELEATIEYAKHFIEDLPRQWFDLGIENKRRFQKLVFPEGLPYLGNGSFGTAKMSVIFEINQQLQNKNANLVGPIGFEPMTKRL